MPYPATPACPALHSPAQAAVAVAAHVPLPAVTVVNVIEVWGYTRSVGCTGSLDTVEQLRVDEKHFE